MSQRASILATVLVMPLAIVAVAAGSSSLGAPGTIRITDRLVKHIHVDAGARGRSAGDIDFYRQSLFNKKVTPKAIGHADEMCTDTGSGSLSCTGTYFLPKGKLMVAGVIATRLFYELAVIGGTGLYDNARGTLTVTHLAGTPGGQFLIFRLAV